MEECELCGDRYLASSGNDYDGYELYFTVRCQGCGHIPIHRNDLHRIARFTNGALDIEADFARNSKHPRSSADASRQTSLWPFEVE